jgi:hypothetical protein
VAEFAFGAAANQIAALGSLSASSLGTAVPTHASANTKGAWVEFSAAAPFDIAWLLVNIAFRSTAARDALLDIGVGAEGSEQVIISDIQISNSASIGCWQTGLRFPVHIPAGARIAMRSQCSTGGTTTLTVVMHAIAGTLGSMPVPHTYDTYGAAEADSGGASVDSGASANTKGAYSQLTAATLHPIRLLWVFVGSQLLNRASGCCTAFIIDVSIGDAGSEIVVVEDMLVDNNSITDLLTPVAFGPFIVDIPAGLRLSARAAGNTAQNTVLDVSVIGAG